MCGGSPLIDLCLFSLCFVVELVVGENTQERSNLFDSRSPLSEPVITGRGDVMCGGSPLCLFCFIFYKFWLGSILHVGEISEERRFFNSRSPLMNRNPEFFNHAFALS